MTDVKLDRNQKPDVFGIEILMNQRLLKSFYHTKSDVKDKETSVDEKREIWLKEKIYRIKENMLYNNLNIKFFKNFSIANIYYFKNYLKISEDFDSVNFNHLQQMRSFYLSLVLNNSLIPNNKLSLSANNTLSPNSFLDFLHQQITHPSANNNIISIISSLCSILYSNVTEFDIIMRLFNNILFEITKLDKNSNLTYDVVTEIDQNLLMLMDVLEKKIFKIKEIDTKLKVSFLEKLLNISLEFQSICLFLMTISQLRTLDIVLDDCQSIQKYFKRQVKNIISLPSTSNSINKLKYSSDFLFKSFDFFVDEKYLYLFIAHKGIFKIGTGYLGSLIDTIYQEYIDVSLPHSNIFVNKNYVFLINHSENTLNLYQFDKFTLQKTAHKSIKINNKILQILLGEECFYIFEQVTTQRIEEDNETSDSVKKEVVLRKINPFVKETERKVTFKDERSIITFNLLFTLNLPYLFYEMKYRFIDYSNKLIYSLSLSSDSLKDFSIKESKLEQADLVPSSKLLYSKYQNVVFAAVRNEKILNIESYYNILSSPFSSYQRFKKIFKKDIKYVPYKDKRSIDSLVNLKYFLTSKAKDIEFHKDAQEAHQFFLYLLSNLLKVVLIKGNNEKSYKKYVNKDKLNDNLSIILKKSVYNDMSQNLIRILYSEYISKYLNTEVINLADLKEIYSIIILIKNFFTLIKEFSIDFEIYNEGEKGFNYYSLSMFFQRFINSKLFDSIEEKEPISNLKEYALLKEGIINESFKTIKLLISNIDNKKINLIDIIFEIITNNQEKLDLKLELLSILQSNDSIFRQDEDILKRLIEVVFKIESQLLTDLSEDKVYQLTNPKILIFNENFKNFFLRTIFNRLKDWNFNDLLNPLTNIFKQLLDYLLQMIQSYLAEEQFKIFETLLINNQINKSIFLNYIDNHSIIFQITLFFVQIVIQNKTLIKDFPFDYLNIIVNVIIKLDEFSSKVLKICNIRTTKENINNDDKYYIYDTEHPCENDIKRSVCFTFNKMPVYSQFDCLSRLNSDSTASIELFTIDDKKPENVFTYNENFPINMTLLNNEKIVLNYNPKSKKNVNSYGFQLKLSSLQENYGIFSNNDIITDIRRSLIYSICNIIFHLFDSAEEQKELKKDKFIYKSIFNSKLLENICIKENLNVSLSFSKIFKNLVKNLDENFQKELNEIFFEYKSEPKSLIEENIEETINFILQNKDQFFEKGIKYLQKVFVMKNVWGNLGGKEVETLVIYVFCILIKHQNILNRYMELLSKINSFSEEIKIDELHSLPDFNLFLKIWTESSKLRIWFNEKKMLIAENVEAKKEELSNVNNEKQMIQEETLAYLNKEIDEEISMLFVNLSKKADFILRTIRPSMNSLLNKDEIEQKDYQVFIDICENLLIYLKTDEINLEKINAKIKSQNEKAIKKETSLMALNLLLYIVNNEQDQRDILYWVNIIQRQNKRIISFVDDIYGADYRIIDKVKNQFHIFIKILIQKCLRDNTSIFTYVNLIQSLVWKIKGRDFDFLKNVKFFELFENHSYLSQLLLFNVTNNFFGKNKHYYGKERYDLRYLQKSFFELFQIYSLQIVKKVNEYKIESIEKRASSSSSLYEFSRQVSLIDHNEITTIQVLILQIINKEVFAYLEKNYLFLTNPEENTPYNEEKINSYFILLYRLLTNNHDLNVLLLTYFPDFFGCFFEVFLICSDKNKSIIIKLINRIINETEPKYSEVLLIAFNGFRNILKERYNNIYVTMNIDIELQNKENEAEFIVHYLFKLIVILQSEEDKLFWRSESDYEISWEIIDLLRNLLSLSTFKGEIMNYIKNAFVKNTEKEKNIVFILLGANFNIIKVGSSVNIRLKIDTESKNNLYDLNEFTNFKEKSFIKKGTILGFTDNPKNPFIIDELITEFTYHQLSYNPKKKFALVILEENLTKETIKNSSYDCILVETDSLIPEEDNLLNDEDIITAIKEIKLIKFCFNELLEPNLPMQKKYYSLKLIKNIINSNSTSIKEHFFKEISEGNLFEKVFKSLEELSLSNLTSRFKQKPFEILERTSINEILSLHKENPEEGKESSSNSLLLSIESNSVFVKFNKNLIKELSLLKVYNLQKVKLFMNKFIELVRFDLHSSKINRDACFVVRDSNDLIKEDVINALNSFNKYLVITDESLINSESFAKLFETQKINFPVVCISTYDLISLNNFIFENNSSQEYEELFLQSIQRDFSSLIEIPSVMVDESVKFGQRDLVLKIVGEERTSGSVNKEVKINGRDCIIKLCSLISRRIILKLYIDFPECCRGKLDVEKFRKIFKLLIYENNLLNLLNSTYYELQNNISNFIKNLDQFNHYDNMIINKLVNLDFLNKMNNIDYSILENVDVEEELLQFDNTENDLKIIYAFIKNGSIRNLQIKDFEMKLFYGLTNKLNEFIIKNAYTGEFVIDVLNILLDYIYNLVENNDSYMIKTVSDYAVYFTSEEFTNILKKIKTNIFDISANKENNTISIEPLESKLLKFFVFFIDLAFKLYIEHEIDLNIKNFFEHKIFSLYYSYCLLTKKFKNLGFFILFCEKEDYAQLNSDLNIKIDMNYSSDYPHLRKFSFPDIDRIYLKLNKINYKYNESVFVYSDKHCKNLQDYFTCEDTEKEIIIKNKFNNSFYISTPYSNYKNVLYASGSNENYSLGADVTLGNYFGTPQVAVGIESNYIKSFKYGYYHCFVLSYDGNLYVNGKDTASSLKIESSPKFTLENHFHELGQKEGIENIWVNNFNSTILLTKTNKLMAAGNNTDGLLSRNMPGSSKVPVEMKALPNPNLKVKLVSCGYKTTLIVMEDGSAYALGCNSYYETTNRATKDIQYDYYKMNIPENHKVINAVAGEHYFLLLIEEPNKKTRLYSVGSYECGRTGVDNDSSCHLQRCRGVENLEFRAISSRNLSSAAISREGQLYTFGNNEVGNLGLGHKQEVKKPTLVETLSDYLVDEVCIAHNHMLVIARNNLGEKKLFSCGVNSWGSLCFNDLSKSYDKPEEVEFFKSNNLTPIKVSNSRYQSFILNLDSKISSEKSDFKQTCSYCNKAIYKVMFFSNKSTTKRLNGSEMDHSNNIEVPIPTEVNNNIDEITNKNVEKKENVVASNYKKYVCESCVNNHHEVLFLANLPSNKIDEFGFISHDEIIKGIENVEENLVYEKEFDQKINNSDKKFNFEYKCCDCFKPINGIVNISTDNLDLILCLECINDHSNKIEYPQIFYSFNNKIRLSYYQKKNLPKLNLSSTIYGVKDNPVCSMEIIICHSFAKKLKQITESKQVRKLYKKWCMLKNEQLISLNELKDEYYDQKNCNNVSLNNHSLLEFLKKFDVNKYQNLRGLDEESFKILNDASCAINEKIFELMSITYNMKEKGNFINLAVSQNLNLVSSRARLNIFQERLSKLKVSVNPNDKEITLSRMKALKFYEKNIVDTKGEFTIFGQLFNKMKKFSVSNYRAKKDNRLFVVFLAGEGATDYGGPYRDILSTASEELHSNYLDLFIKSPNHKNEIGSLRDKYIINPGAKSALQLDMFVFIGYLMGYAICSGYLINLNLHPVIWKLILNQKVEFAEYETIDKLFYKLLLDIEKTEIKTTKDFEACYDLNYVIQLSDRSEVELKPKGKTTQVTYVITKDRLNDKDKFIELAKAQRINEFKIQIDSIRFGLINVIPESILSLITWKELEDLSCGKPTLNIDILKERTEYQSFRSDDKAIQNFWTVLENFSNEEKVLYLKYVWGRSRLPDPSIFPFTHIISKLSHTNPDTRLPSATTCYFTLKLPAYSSLEVMAQKLKYVIYNCSEIDADFAVTSTPDI